jgi:SAM-dependent methyltransferase
LLAGVPLPYGRRLAGRHYTPACIAAGDRAVAADRVMLVCGDALDPPLLPDLFDRVVALNLLDAVAEPRQLLVVMAGLCAPGGELILASPYAWQSGIVNEDARIGGADPGLEVAGILRDGTGLPARFRIEDEADLTWALRRDARTAVTYRTHYLRARRL